METHHFFTRQRVLIVAGKGGVGKSAVASALATASARAGLRTLLVSLNPDSTGVQGQEHLESVAVTPGGALTDYLSSKGMGLLSRQLSRSGIVELVATTAPGLDDLLVLGRIKAFEKELRADVIIVDGPAAGHAVDFVRAPSQLKGAIPSGPIGQQADEVITMLADPGRCRVVIVTTPAMTPVMESTEVIEELTGARGITIAAVVVNKCEPTLPAIDVSVLPADMAAAVRYGLEREASQRSAIAELARTVDIDSFTVQRHLVEGGALLEQMTNEIESGIAGLA